MKFSNLVLVVVISAMLPGCFGRDAQDMKKNLATLVDEKHIHTNDPGVALVFRETNQAALIALGDEARAAAKKENNSLNKLTYFRISAMAYWKAESTKVADAAMEGEQVCLNDKNKINLAPTDCGLMLIVPQWAALEGLAKEFKAAEKINRNSSVAEKKKVDNLFDDVVGRYKGVSKAAKAIFTSKASSATKDAVRQNMKKSYCFVRTTFSLWTLVYTGAGPIAAAKENVVKGFTAGYPSVTGTPAPATC